MLLDWDTVSSVDCVRSGALLIAFIATVFADKKGSSEVWLWADNIVSVAFGLALYCFPNVLLDYQTEGKLDLVHQFCAQCCGMLILSMSVTWFLKPPAKTRGDATQSIWLISRLLTSAFLLTLLGIRQSKLGDKVPGFSKQNVTFVMFGCALWMFGHLYQLFRQKDFGSKMNVFRIGDRMSFHLFIDLIFVMVEWLSVSHFPRMVARWVDLKDFKQDAIHDFQMQAVGILDLNVLFYGLLLLVTAQDTEEKRAYFIGRAAMLALCLFPFAWYQWYYNLFSTCNLFVWLGAYLLPTINILAAAMYKRKLNPFSK